MINIMAEIVKDKRLVLGIALVFLGVVLLGDNYDLFDFLDWRFREALFSWMTLLIFIGGVLFLTRPNKGPGIILMIIGTVFFIDYVINFEFNWSDLWPLAFILVGVLFLLRGRFSQKGRDSLGKTDMDHLDDVSIFGGGDKVVSSDNFKGGKVTSIFGGSEYDMTQARLSGGTNVIDVFAMFGGSSFTVPDDWNVRVEVTAIFGGFTDKRKRDPNEIPDPRKELFVKGIVLFGGGEVKSYKPRR